MTYFGIVLAIAVQAYLLGSLQSGVIISKLVYKDDVRKHGSGNSGMTNMVRTYGKMAGAGTFFGDTLKGALAVIFGQMLFGMMPHTIFSPLAGGYIAFLFAVIGHMYPVVFGFRGGKGVAVGAGCLIALNPVVVAGLAIVFFACFLPTRMVSLGSVTAAICFPIFTAVYAILVQKLQMPDLVLSVSVALFLGSFVTYGHRTNIKRILNGTEYQFKKKK